MNVILVGVDLQL